MAAEKNINDRLDASIKGLIEQHTNGPGDDVGLARVADMVNWAFTAAAPPDRLVLRWAESGDVEIGFAYEMGD